MYINKRRQVSCMISVIMEVKCGLGHLQRNEGIESKLGKDPHKRAAGTRFPPPWFSICCPKCQHFLLSRSGCPESTEEKQFST